jgi:hypothetical protein
VLVAERSMVVLCIGKPALGASVPVSLTKVRFAALGAASVPATLWASDIWVTCHSSKAVNTDSSTLDADIGKVTTISRFEILLLIAVSFV